MVNYFPLATDEFTHSLGVQALNELTPSQQQRLCKVLQSCPPSTVAYQGLSEIAIPVTRFLQANSERRV